MVAWFVGVHLYDVYHVHVHLQVTMLTSLWPYIDTLCQKVAYLCKCVHFVCAAGCYWWSLQEARSQGRGVFIYVISCACFSVLSINTVCSVVTYLTHRCTYVCMCTISMLLVCRIMYVISDCTCVYRMSSLMKQSQQQGMPDGVSLCNCPKL